MESFIYQCTLGTIYIDIKTKEYSKLNFRIWANDWFLAGLHVNTFMIIVFNVNVALWQREGGGVQNSEKNGYAVCVWPII